MYIYDVYVYVCTYMMYMSMCIYICIDIHIIFLNGPAAQVPGKTCWQTGITTDSPSLGDDGDDIARNQWV